MELATEFPAFPGRSGFPPVFRESQRRYRSRQLALAHIPFKPLVRVLIACTRRQRLPRLRVESTKNPHKLCADFHSSPLLTHCLSPFGTIICIGVGTPGNFDLDAAHLSRTGQFAACGDSRERRKPRTRRPETDPARLHSAHRATQTPRRDPKTQVHRRLIGIRYSLQVAVCVEGARNSPQI